MNYDNLFAAFKLMGQGMLAVFAVMAVIALIVYAVSAVSKKLNR